LREGGAEIIVLMADVREDWKRSVKTCKEKSLDAGRIEAKMRWYVVSPCSAVLANWMAALISKAMVW
jgi:hypothetical protein